MSRLHVHMWRYEMVGQRSVLAQCKTCGKIKRSDDNPERTFLLLSALGFGALMFLAVVYLVAKKVGS